LSVGKGDGLSAVTVQLSDMHVSVNVAPFWLIDHEAQLGSVKLTVALLWPWAGRVARASSPANNAKMKREDRVMSVLD
jgi:hypothetical protein